MAFTVEDGTIVSGANSYITVTFADDYHADRGESAWANANQTAKEQAIIKATDYLDSHYIFKSNPVSDSQFLKFPRTEFGTDVIPLPIKQATAIYSLFALNNDLYDTDKVEITGNVKKTRSKQKVGEIEVETENEFQGSGTIKEIQENRFDSIQFLIYPYIVSKQQVTSSSTSSSTSKDLPRAAIPSDLFSTRS